MTGLITISTIGVDTGPFNIYSNVDGFVSPFETNINRTQLIAGFFTNNIPDNTVKVKVVDLGNCSLFIDIILETVLCYRFFPELGYYFTDYLYKPTTTYLYGTFDSFENGVDVIPLGKIVRLNNDLTIDETFVTGTGFDAVLYDGSSIIEQPDGKIIATGTFISYNGISANRIIRLNVDGSVDSNFIYGTGFNNFTQSGAVDSLERIIITGIYSVYNGFSASKIIRLLSNGTKDPSFITGTGFDNTTIDVLINSDDSMYITGYFSAYNGTGGLGGICKLDSLGTIDLTFKTNSGVGFNPYTASNPNNFARLPGETSFYVAGYFTSYNGISANRIIKLNSDGSIDGSFSSGTGFNLNVSTIKVIWNDKLIITGSFTEYNGIISNKTIILNADGSVYLALPFDTYHSPFVIQNTLYGALLGECLQPIHEYNATTTTTTTLIPWTEFTVGPSIQITCQSIAEPLTLTLYHNGTGVFPVTGDVISTSVTGSPVYETTNGVHYASFGELLTDSSGTMLLIECR